MELMNSRIAVSVVRLAVLASLATLSACTWTSGMLEGNKLDYKSQATVKVKTLEVPPDLVQSPRDDKYDVPGDKGPATLSTYTQQKANAPANPGVEVVPVIKDARMERAGGQRWLVVNLSPDQVWPIAKEFWQEQGFLIKTEDQATGIMETDWAENRAKIPQDFIRNTIGKYIDGLYSTGERDKFRTRVERSADGGSEIYISHRGAKETLTGVQKDNTIWEPRASDPELEAEFLRRLLVRLGQDKEQAKTVVASGYVTPNSEPVRSKLVPGGNGTQPYVELVDPFDRAWRRVGLALDRVGFTVEDRDRNQGVYFVRYVDPKGDVADKPGLLSRIFTSADERTKQAAQYRIALRTQSSLTRITVQDKNGVAVTTDVGGRILALVNDQLK
jgi:outer membrane protein assembly factor BamC